MSQSVLSRPTMKLLHLRVNEYTTTHRQRISTLTKARRRDSVLQHYFIATCIFYQAVCVQELIELSLCRADIVMFVDKNGDYESLLPAVIVLAVIAIVAIIAGVILLILYIKLRAAYKRL